MKALFMSLFLITFVAVSHAQTSTPENDTPLQEIIKEQIEELHLSGDQKEKFIEISQAHMQKLQEVKNNDASKMSKFKSIKTLRTEKNKQMESLLDASQYETYKELQAENQKKLKKAFKERNL